VKCTWSADAGTIDQSGHYVAPPERPASGMATVRATSNAYPDLFDEVTFAIGYTCNYAHTLGGEMVTAQPGDVLTFTSGGPNKELSGVSVRTVFGNRSWEAFVLPLGDDPSSWPSGPGSWPVRVQGDMGLTDPSEILWSSDDEFAPLLELDHFQPGSSIAGYADGATVEIISTVDPRSAPFDWWFSIVYQPGQFTCTVPGAG